MSQYSARNVTVNFNEGLIYATSATATSTKSVEPIRTLGNLLSRGQTTTGPVETTVSLEYYLKDAADPIKSVLDTIILSPLAYAISAGNIIKIGGGSINKCYLTSYSLTADANSLVTASASFFSVGKEQDLLMSTATAGTATVENLKFAHGAGTTSAILSKTIGFTYEVSLEWEPLILMGKAGEPEAGMLFKGGNQTLNAKGIGLGQKITYCAVTKVASVAVGLLCGGNTSMTISMADAEITSAEISNNADGFQEESATFTKPI
jgi:hypothetical protein